MTSPLILYQKLIAEAKSNSQTGLSSSLLKRGAFFSAAISCMACSTSLLRLSLFGNDPYSCMNLGYSLLTGLSFGSCVSIFNVLLLIPMLTCGRATCASAHSYTSSYWGPYPTSATASLPLSSQSRPVISLPASSCF